MVEYYLHSHTHMAAVWGILALQCYPLLAALFLDQGECNAALWAALPHCPQHVLGSRPLFSDKTHMAFLRPFVKIYLHVRISSKINIIYYMPLNCRCMALISTNKHNQLAYFVFCCFPKTLSEISRNSPACGLLQLGDNREVVDSLQKLAQNSINIQDTLSHCELSALQAHAPGKLPQDVCDIVAHIVKKVQQTYVHPLPPPESYPSVTSY